MEWNTLIQKKISRVFYLDEHGLTGHYEPEMQVHLLDYGSVLIGLTSDEWFLVENDYERKGLSLIPYQQPLPEAACEIKWNQDPVWSHVGDTAIEQVNCYPGYYMIGRNGGKFERVEIVGTVEICFEFGARVFVSNAGLDEAGKLQSDIFNMALYCKRKIGKDAGLIG